jgi:hypothetical protein
MLQWTLHKNPPTWEEIIHITEHIADADKNITKIFVEYRRFHEFIYITNISEIRMHEGNTKSFTFLKII